MDICLTINGQEYKVNTGIISPEITLNTFIRQHAKLTGTKFMCLEGGCGACVVSVARQNPLTNKLETIAVNSCLQPVHVCNGYQVTTIEGLGNRYDGYHPLQTSLTRMHGSQCGYCTGGMIMNMYAQLEQPDNDDEALSKPTMVDVEQSFGGNMCRCTGYRPILEAFRSFAADASTAMRQKCRATGSTADIEEMPRLCVGRQHCIDLGMRITSHVQVQQQLTSPAWQLVTTLPDLLATLGRLDDDEPYQLVVGNTARGIQAPSPPVRTFIGINGIAELHRITQTADALTIGAAVTLSQAIRTLRHSARLPGFEYCAQLAHHYTLVANVPVRNVGSLAGNLCFKHEHPEFPSDVFVTLDTVDARLTVIDSTGKRTDLSPVAFLAYNMRKRLLFSIRLPRIDPGTSAVRTYKTSIRAQNAHAYVNAGILVRFAATESGAPSSRILEARVCFGGIRPQFTHAIQTEQLLRTITDLYTDASLLSLLRSLDSELDPDWRLPDAQPAYRKQLAQAMFYRFVLDTCHPADRVSLTHRSGAAAAIERPLSSGVQDFQTVRTNWPLTEPVPKYEGLQQASGEAVYIGDMPTMGGELWAAFVLADRVHCSIARIEPTAALAMEGVHHFYAASDIPGRNSFTPITIFTPFVEPVLLAVGAEVQFNGQPVGIVLADSIDLANRAADLVRITYVETEVASRLSRLTRTMLGPWLMVDDEQTRLIRPTVHSVPMANMIGALPIVGSTPLAVSGRFELAGQYHYHMETLTAICVPNEERARSLKVFCATQWADFTQLAIAEMLAIPQNHVQMIVRRLGGAFGAKITRATLVGCAAALGSFLSRRPVRLRMSLETNMRVVGKRFGVIADYRAEVEPTSGRVQRCDCTYVQDAGSSMNESVLALTTPSFANCYDATGWKVTGTMVQTDAPSNTFCRSPGTLEGIAMGENMMEHIASVTGLPPMQVRLANMRPDHPMRPMISEFMVAIEFDSRRSDCDRFNSANRWRKRGIAVVPMQWPLIYYGAIPAYVAVYHGDGSVVVTHGGIECGQGINTKVAQVVAYALAVPLDMVEVRPMDTVTAANAMLTGSSCTSEMVCYAAKRACDIILARMQPVRSTMKAGYTWADLVAACHVKQIDLRETYQFKTTDVESYDIYGMCACETEVDVLTGCYQLRRVDLWEDVGESMSPLVDVGQVEGAFVMGIGYWCTEQLVYDRNDGRLLTDRTWTYKPPGALDIPVDFRVKFIQNSANPIVGVLRSKAVGEPAICMSVVILFALRNAIKSARNDAGIKYPWFQLGSATTPEKVFMQCANNINQFTI